MGEPHKSHNMSWFSSEGFWACEACRLCVCHDEEALKKECFGMALSQQETHLSEVVDAKDKNQYVHQSHILKAIVKDNAIVQMVCMNCVATAFEADKLIRGCVAIDD